MSAIKNKILVLKLERFWQGINFWKTGGSGFLSPLENTKALLWSLLSFDKLTDSSEIHLKRLVFDWFISVHFDSLNIILAQVISKFWRKHQRRAEWMASLLQCHVLPWLTQYLASFGGTDKTHGIITAVTMLPLAVPQIGITHERKAVW